MTPHERDAVILVVVAHPDDAEITAGGTIALLTAAGARVVVAVLSLPERGVQGDLRREMTEQSASILGYELIWPLQPIVHQVSDVSETRLVSTLDALVRDVQPSCVVTHWGGDGHVDHALTSRAVTAALRSSRITLLSMRPAEPQTAAIVNFQPIFFVDITRTIDTKAEALLPFGTLREGFRPVDLAAVVDIDRYFGRLSATSAAEAFGVERLYDAVVW